MDGRTGEGPETGATSRCDGTATSAAASLSLVRALGLDDAFDPREGPAEDDAEAWVGDDPGDRD